MHIAVRARQEQIEAWLNKTIPTQATVAFIGEDADLYAADADIYFDLAPAGNRMGTEKISRPVFINAVTETLDEFPPNFIRINAWNTFFQRPVLEIAACEQNKNIIKNVMNIFGWQYTVVPDVPGMIAARIVSMIINEAYFAIGDKVSSKEDIDIAMKLGTNYPFGPFEWGEKIGLVQVYNLLRKLSMADERYSIAPALEQQVSESGSKD